MAELADAPDLGSGIFDVQVQVLSGAPYKDNPQWRDSLLGVIFVKRTLDNYSDIITQKKPPAVFCLPFNTSRIPEGFMPTPCAADFIEGNISIISPELMSILATGLQVFSPGICVESLFIVFNTSVLLSG